MQGNRRRTIGLLTNQLEGEYHSMLWRTVNSTLTVLDANLIVYSGKCLRSNFYFEAQENVLYDMVDLDMLDGVLLSSGSLGNYTTREEYAAFARKYAAKPVVSISMPIEGIPAICVENKNGMKSVVSHLIESHGHKRIAFIGGIEYNPDAIARFEAYKEALAEHDIPCEPDLVFQGDFSIISGERAARLLFERHGTSVHAVVASNDGMALGAIHALKERGVRIPEDVAIIGFDDIIDAKFSYPPLTSVHQPVSQIAQKGVEMLFDLMDGKDVPEIVYYPAIPVIRQSCGCLPISQQDNRWTSRSSFVDGEADSITARMKTEYANKILQFMKVPDFLKTKYTDIISALLERLANDIDSPDSQRTFLDVLNREMIRTVIEDDEEVSWQDSLYIMRNIVVSSLSSPEKRASAEEIMLQAQIIAGKIYERKEGLLKHSRSQQDISLRNYFTTVSILTEMDNLFPIVVDSIQHFEIQRCYLSFFEQPEEPRRRDAPWNIPEQSRLRVFVHGDLYDIHDESGPLFRSSHLVPADYHPAGERFSWTVRILYSGEEKYGFIIFDLKNADENVLVTLHDIYRSGLEATMFSKKRRIMEDALKARSAQLEESNKKLEALDDLKNDFIANITHDFRSTLTIILNNADLGITGEEEDKSVTMRRFTSIYNSSLKLKTTIDRLLELAKMDVQGIRLAVRKIDMKNFLETITDFYKSTVVHTHIRIVDILPAGEMDEIYTDPEKLEEVINNVLSNALKFVSPDNGEIRIECRNLGASVVVSIADNGVGIPKDRLDDIFGRFVQVGRNRNSRYTGSGIGLAFAKQLMGYLKGRIWAESEGEGKGAQFFIELPKGKAAFDEKDFAREDAFVPYASTDKQTLSRLLQMELNEKESQDGFSVIFKTLNNDEEYDHKKAIILIVEDNPQIRYIEREYLERAGYVNFILAADGKSGIHAAYFYRPDIVICDYNMPNIKGDEFHDELANNPDFAPIPFIFLTAVANKEIMIERRKKGAIAVLPKPLDEADFLLTVEVNLKRYMNYRQTLKQAIVDELTGLKNRQTILRILRERLALRRYRDLSLIFFDIDHFKQFNDTYGHQAGDRVLTDVGNAVATTIRNYDIAGRYGGEEFLVILPETSIQEAVVVAEKLKERIGSIPMRMGGKKVFITASFGISSLVGNSESLRKELCISDIKDIYEVSDSKGTDWKRINEQKLSISELLISMADKAMYEAKRTRCADCGFDSENELLFVNGACPECGGTSITAGRNRVVQWRD